VVRKRKSHSKRAKKLGRYNNIFYSKIVLIAFVAIFAGLGGYFVWRSFADSYSWNITRTVDGKGYYIIDIDGNIRQYGNAINYGSPRKDGVTGKIFVDIALTASGKGYWALAESGGVYAYGDAKKIDTPLSGGPYVAIIATPGVGYWLVNAWGIPLPYGDAKTAYKLDNTRKNYEDGGYGTIKGVDKIVDADRTVSGRGLYMLDQNGKLYVIGDADNRGGAADLLELGESAASIAADKINSYTIVTTKGRVIPRGTGVKGLGDLSSTNLKVPVVGVAHVGAAQDANYGYWLLSADGSVYNFGWSQFFGSKQRKAPDTYRAAGTPPTKPDIIVFYTDDQRHDEVSFMRNLQNHLASQGVNFSSTFAMNPICCPSRATLLTGGRSWRTGVWNNYDPNGGYKLFQDNEDDTIATRLKAQNYRTGLFGKYMNQYQGRDGGLPPKPVGWDIWRAFRGTNGDYYDYNLVTENGFQMTYGKLAGQTKPEAYYSTDVLADHMVSFLNNTPTGQAAFALYTPYAPHSPYEVAQRHQNAQVPTFNPRGAFNEDNVQDKPQYIRNYDEDAQDKTRPKVDAGEIEQKAIKSRRMLLAVDDALGRVIETQTARGRLRDTVFVYASDNGYMWGEHRIFNKEVPYEESIRIPLYIRYDRMTGNSPKAVSSLVTNADIAATISVLAGTTPPFPDGMSLVPALNAAGQISDRDYVPLDHFPSQLRNRTRENVDIPAYCALRTTRYKLVWYQIWRKDARGEPIINPIRTEGELYDLQSDPTEQMNRFYDINFRSILGTLWPKLIESCERPPTHMSKPPAAPPTSR
jgi:N-acetylglucosamine-6-sulfatase